MANENNVVQDFLGIIPEQDIFSENTDLETLEQKVNEPEDKPVPFHKDPKVQRYVEKEIEKALKTIPSIEHKPAGESVSSDVKDVIEAFTTIIGNDTPEKVRALEKLEKTLNGSDERASTKAIERFAQQQQEALSKQTEAEKAAQDELDTFFDEIEETYDVDLSSNASSAKKLRSDFIDYVRKIAPKDAQGEVSSFPDLVSSFEVFQELTKKQAQPNRAKELASRGLTRSGDTSAAPATGKSWKDVDKFLDSLKK